MMATAAVLSSPSPIAFAADERDWDYRPYRIRTLLAIDAPGGWSQQLTEEMPGYLERRAHAAIGPVWSLDVHLASGSQRDALLSQNFDFSEPPPAEFASDGDKLVLLALRWRPDCVLLTAREYDHYVERWGPPIQRECRQMEALPEQLFAILWQAVAPLARLELDPDDEKLVVMNPRGAKIPGGRAHTPWARPDEIFLPVLRRTTRSGELVENGIQVVPWTYVERFEADDEQRKEHGNAVAHIHSGTRRPFGVRRQGRVEQVAIAIRAQPGETTVRLHSRTAVEKPLVGYDVFTQKPGSEEVSRAGATNRLGVLAIPPGESRVRMLYIKNGGHVLARLPLVPGAEPEVDVPLPDDDPRLAAEARLAALREDLIDVVARRNILMARVRKKIEQGEFAEAQKLVNAIDELPGRSQFNLELTTAARLVRSDDPQIQRRIDQLFEVTQTVLAQYLDGRPISELQDELREAQRKNRS